jgi:hypothetical protein
LTASARRRLLGGEPTAPHASASIARVSFRGRNGAIPSARKRRRSLRWSISTASEFWTSAVEAGG